MTREDKQLLLKDLCARLPYGVICVTTSVYYDNDDNEIGQVQGRLVSINKHGADFVDDRDDTTFGADFEDNGQIGFKPYLRPMSSMTEEEKNELCELCEFYEPYNDRDDYSHYGIEIISEFCVTDEKIPENTINYNVIDWLLSHHFDYRRLIEKGLAIEAPEGMYKVKKI